MSADGVPTGALLIFINLIARHIREEQPDSVVVCWDGGKSEYRRGLYPAYKANRGEHEGPDEPERPFDMAKRFLSLAGIHHVERRGWEADDLIACYWRTIRPIDTKIVILSSDKDLLQLLIQGNVTQVRPATPPNPTDRWDAARVEEHYGVKPVDLSKAMAMIGDTSDGIPGIKGIGPVKAAKLLATTTWEGLLVTQGFEQLDLWHQLIDLRDVPFRSLGLVLAQPPRFEPTWAGSVAYGELTSFLDSYQMESIKTRLLTGSLWHEDAAPWAVSTP
jgi:5'-3' exonuclease